MTEDNKRVFDKLVDEIHHDVHELTDIKEANVDYYD